MIAKHSTVLPVVGVGLALVVRATAAAGAPVDDAWRAKVVEELLSADPGGPALDCIAVLAAGRRSAEVAQGDSAPHTSGSSHLVADLARDHAIAGVRLERRYEHLPLARLSVPPGALPRLAADSRVAAVTANRRVHAQRREGRTLIAAPAVNVAGYDGAAIGIAVLDTGVDWNQREHAPGGPEHPYGKTVVLGEPYNEWGYPDWTGHGTAVAGIAAGVGAGVAPAARVVSVMVLDVWGDGSDESILGGIDLVLASIAAGNPYNIRVANFSLGGTEGGLLPQTSCDRSAPAYEAAFAALLAAGVLPVAAAGNGKNPERIDAPACVSSALAIGAVFDDHLANADPRDLRCPIGQTAADAITCYSNSSPALDALAPSECAFTTPLYEQWCFGGTSAATAYASGAAALLAQACPGCGPDRIRSAIVETGRPLPDTRNGITRNRVDAAAALTRLLDTCPAPPTPAFATASPPVVCRGDAIDLFWDAATGASSYLLQLAGDERFLGAQEVLVRDDGAALPTTESTPSPLHLRVRAQSACGTASPWSAAVTLELAERCARPRVRARLPRGH